MTALEARKLAEDEMKAGKTPKYTDLRDWLEIVETTVTRTPRRCTAR